MARPRFYCPSLSDNHESGALSDATIQLDDEQTRHALKVLRLAVGDEIELFDGRGTLASGRVEIAHRSIAVRIHDVEEIRIDQSGIDVAVAMPKGPRAEDMVNQLSQLGADAMIPLRSDRSIVDPGDGKLDRYRRICIESARQCRRPTLMTITDTTDFNDLLNRDYDLTLFASPKLVNHADLRKLVDAADRTLVLIGPEGGWSPEEISAAESSGAIPFCFSANILRIETAACAAVAVLRYMAL